MTALHVARLALPIAAGCLALAPPSAPHDRARNPTIGSLTAGAPMSEARAAHTATTLGDGRVLVAGGFTGAENSAASAELYELRSGRSLPLPAMITLRHSHSATVLAGGKVLIVGGYETGNRTTASAELFDPATIASIRRAHCRRRAPTTSRRTGDMTVARKSHAAVRLLDGRVLITGGHRGRHADITLFTSTEIYEPERGGLRSTDHGWLRQRHRPSRVVVALSAMTTIARP